MKLDESISSWHNTNIGVVCGKSLRMSTPSRNQSLAMGEEDYFLWCEMMERRQQENERWMQTLLRQMERWREENEELRAQISTVGPSQSPKKTLRRTVEASFLKGIEFSSGSYSRQPEEEPSLAHQMQLDEDTSSTRASRKMRSSRGLHLSDAMRTWLGPQALGMEGQPHMSETLRACLGQPTVIATSGWLSQPLRQ